MSARSPAALGPPGEHSGAVSGAAVLLTMSFIINLFIQCYY